MKAVGCGSAMLVLAVVFHLRSYVMDRNESVYGLFNNAVSSSVHTASSLLMKFGTGSLL